MNKNYHKKKLGVYVNGKDKKKSKN